MRDYKLETDEDGEVLECDCCGSQVATSVFANGLPAKDGRLCEVCSSTFLSHAFWYPEQVSDTRLYKSIAIIANMILARLPPEKT